MNVDVNGKCFYPKIKRTQIYCPFSVAITNFNIRCQGVIFLFQLACIPLKSSGVRATQVDVRAQLLIEKRFITEQEFFTNLKQVQINYQRKSRS